jgi:hypothetical protein
MKLLQVGIIDLDEKILKTGSFFDLFLKQIESIHVSLVIHISLSKYILINTCKFLTINTGKACVE